ASPTNARAAATGNNVNPAKVHTQLPNGERAGGRHTVAEQTALSWMPWVRAVRRAKPKGTRVTQHLTKLQRAQVGTLPPLPCAKNARTDQQRARRTQGNCV